MIFVHGWSPGVLGVYWAWRDRPCHDCDVCACVLMTLSSESIFLPEYHLTRCRHCCNIAMII